MDTPWYKDLTIDLIAKILTNSIFHPFITWLIPLCLRAIATPYHAPDFIVSCAWAALVTLAAILSVFNKRIAYGLPREVDWNEEVVVITGGASGLGKILAEVYGMRGASVAVLDIQKPEKESEGLAGVQYYMCDIGDASAIEKAKEQIEKDLGTPTILINNAVILQGKSLLALSAAEVQQSLNVNLLSHFHTLRIFLPGMIASPIGGTIVTIASVLGKFSASHLSDYCAAKAGLIAMHKSLRIELSGTTAPEGAENIKTILVTPGQLSTRLFENLKTPNNFLGPVVEPVELAKEIVRLIDAGKSGEISMPLYARWIEWIFVLPVGVQEIIRRLGGADAAMERASTAISAPKRRNGKSEKLP